MGLGCWRVLGSPLLASFEVLGLCAASSLPFAVSSSLLVLGEVVPLLLLLLDSLLGLGELVCEGLTKHFSA